MPRTFSHPEPSPLGAIAAAQQLAGLALEGHGLDDVDEEFGDACHYCGCTELAACVTPTGACSWYKLLDGFAVCSATACVQAYLLDPGAP